VDNARIRLRNHISRLVSLCDDPPRRGGARFLGGAAKPFCVGGGKAAVEGSSSGVKRL